MPVDPALIEASFSAPALHIDGAIVLGNGSPVIRIAFYEQFIVDNQPKATFRAAISVYGPTLKAIHEQIGAFLDNAEQMAEAQRVGPSN